MNVPTPPPSIAEDLNHPPLTPPTPPIQELLGPGILYERITSRRSSENPLGDL